MELRLIVMALICLCIAQLAFASVDNYPFVLEQQQRSFVQLTKQIRCTACQTQTLYDSNSSVAQEMRAQIYKMINAGMTDAKIRKYLSDTYGDYILLMPAWEKETAFLWLGPFIMLSIAIFSLWRWVVYKRQWL